MFVDVCWCLLMFVDCSRCSFSFHDPTNNWRQDLGTAFLPKTPRKAPCHELWPNSAWKVKWSLTPKFWSLFLAIGMSRNVQKNDHFFDMKRLKDAEGLKRCNMKQNKQMAEARYHNLNHHEFASWTMGCGRSNDSVGSGWFRMVPGGWVTQDLGLVRYGFR